MTSTIENLASSTATGAPVASNVLASKAMLSNVRISTWSARKVDKAVTQEINSDKGAAADAGRYNKSLLDKKALEPIMKIQSEARALHYRLTLPWQDDGARILPAMAFIDYKSQLETIGRKFETAVDEFISGYDTEREAAKTRLGKMFNDQDYPTKSEVRRKFGFEVIINPVPSGDDFRVSMGEAQAEMIKAEIEARAAANLQDAMKDLYRRIGEVCERMAETLKNYKPARGDEKAQGIFRDSLVTNVIDLAGVLPTLNIASDPHLAAIADRMKANLTKYDANALRENSRVRSEVAEEAQAILDDIADFIM